MAAATALVLLSTALAVWGAGLTLAYKHLADKYRTDLTRERDRWDALMELLTEIPQPDPDRTTEQQFREWGLRLMAWFAAVEMHLDSDLDARKQS